MVHDPKYVIQTKAGLYWAAADLVEDIEHATKFPNSERKVVRLRPGEKWVKFDA